MDDLDHKEMIDKLTDTALSNIATIREQFAMAALTGLISHYGIKRIDLGGWDPEYDYNVYVSHAIAIANIMMEERKKVSNGND